jgi:hypothetical protein
MTIDRHLVNVVYFFWIVMEVPTFMPSAWMLGDSGGHWLW